VRAACEEAAAQPLRLADQATGRDETPDGERRYHRLSTIRHIARGVSGPARNILLGNLTPGSPWSYHRTAVAPPRGRLGRRPPPGPGDRAFIRPEPSPGSSRRRDPTAPGVSPTTLRPGPRPSRPPAPAGRRAPRPSSPGRSRGRCRRSP